jgi:hypothetical protein
VHARTASIDTKDCKSACWARCRAPARWRHLLSRFAFKAENDKAYDALAARLAAADVSTRSGEGDLEFADPWGTRSRLVKT